MKTLQLFSCYLIWHYSTALGDIWGIWGNFLYFISHFFSFSDLLRTLFAPWRRLQESYSGQGFSLERVLTALVVNTMMRLVGMIIRLAVMIVGLLCLAALAAAGAAVYVIWLLAPLLVTFLLVTGAGLLVIG